MTTTGLSKMMMTAGAAILGIAALTQTSNAQASDFHFAVNVAPRSGPIVYEPSRRWVPERYESREVQVLVAPAHPERKWVPERHEVQYDRRGRAITVCIPGYWTEVVCPARYETRVTRVLVPGYWVSVPVSYDRPGHWDGHYGHDYRRDDWRDRRDDRRPDFRIQAGYSSR
jgi:hypothetical protein